MKLLRKVPRSKLIVIEQKKTIKYLLPALYLGENTPVSFDYISRQYMITIN
jgi:hypothetical protein